MRVLHPDRTGIRSVFVEKENLRTRRNTLAARQEPTANNQHMAQGARFSKAPETFRAHKAIAKSPANLAITELFYLHILKMKGGFLHTRSFRRIHFSVFRYR